MTGAQTCAQIIISKPTMSSRNWCFTLFAYMWEDIESLLALKCRGIIFQEEMCPTTHQPHLQGFVRFDTALNRDAVKTRMGFDRVHVEPSVAPSAAVEYCRKGDTRMGECYEEGDLFFEQGKSSQVRALCEEIAQGATMSHIISEYPVECIRHSRGIQFVKFWHDKIASAKDRDITVIVLSGSPGSGKTRAAYEYDRTLYKVDRAAASGEIWFDGYDGEKTLLIDDFYGWIPYSQLLNILDRYPLRLSTKGGHGYAGYSTIIITSNALPRAWYKEACDFRALSRRIHFLVTDDQLRLQPLEAIVRDKLAPSCTAYYDELGRKETILLRAPRASDTYSRVSVPNLSYPTNITIEGEPYVRQPNGTYAAGRPDVPRDYIIPTRRPDTAPGGLVQRSLSKHASVIDLSTDPE